MPVIGDWIALYNQKRPHQALKMMTPDAADAATLVARPEQKTVDLYKQARAPFGAFVIQRRRVRVQCSWRALSLDSQ